MYGGLYLNTPLEEHGYFQTFSQKDGDQYMRRDYRMWMDFSMKDLENDRGFNGNVHSKADVPV